MENWWKKKKKLSSDTASRSGFTRHFKISEVLYIRTQLYATAWVRRLRYLNIGTTHSDYFSGFHSFVRVIWRRPKWKVNMSWKPQMLWLERFEELNPDLFRCFIKNHGPFSWGKCCDAVHNAVVMEQVNGIYCHGVNPDLTMNENLIKNIYQP